jgi:hypothetical protein
VRNLASAIVLAVTAAFVAPVNAAPTPAPAPTADAQDSVGLSDARSFVARHRVTTEPSGPAVIASRSARAAQSDGQTDVTSSASEDPCLRDVQREPRVDEDRMDIASTALSRCDGAGQRYLLKLHTFAEFDASSLDAMLIVLDTDVNAGTGCDGDDFFVLGYYDDGNGGSVAGSRLLLADVVQTPSCDDLGWSYRGEARLDHADDTDVARLSWDAGQIDAPRAVRYAVDLTNGTTYDTAPSAGAYVLSSNSPPKTYPTPAAREIGDTCDTQVGTPFIDTVGTTHAYSINCVSGRGVTKGKTAITYDPEGTLSKGQTATFLINTLKAAGYTLSSTTGTCPEDDVHADSMSLLIGAGIIPRPRDGACGPAQTISRELMALWTRNTLVYGRTYGDRGTDWYSDDTDSDFEPVIDEIAGLGVVTGKGNALFGPRESLTRGQMATFLARVLDALIEKRQ